MKVFVITPVRNLTSKEEKTVTKYIQDLENKGITVHFPPRDTNQNDSIGINICKQNREAILESDEVHIFWNVNSKGSLFDFGMSFMADKKIRLINLLKSTPAKSFENVLLRLNEDCR